MKRICLGLVVLAALLPAQGTLEVIAAYYGADRNFVDATATVRALAQPDGVAFTVGAESMGGDPFPGQLKSLRVYYKLSGQFQSGEWKDSDAVMIGRVSANSRRGLGRDRRGSPLTITRAVYGVVGRTVDVTGIVQSRMLNNQLDLEVAGNLLGDPAPGSVKELVVTYEQAGRTLEARARDGERLRLGSPLAGAATPAPVALPPPPPTGLKIISALYGSGNRVLDVTGNLASRVATNRLAVSVDNKTMGGDPAVAADKVLNVSFEWNGQRYTASAKEGQTLRLPPDQLLTASPAPATPATPSLPADGVCFYPAANFQGTPICAALGQDQPRVASTFGSVRLFGRARLLDLYETANYTGRTVRLTADSADLNQVGGGGFFGNAVAWAPNLGSFRLSQ